MDEQKQNRTDSLEEIGFFETATLTPQEKRQINLGLALIGRRMCEVCDQEDNLTEFPFTNRGDRTYYRYICRKCYSAARTKAMNQRYKTDPVYRAERIQAAQDYRAGLKNKTHYKREAVKRARRRRLKGKS